MANYNRIPEVLAELQPLVDAAIAEALEAVVESAKARVPRVSGRLHDAIHIEREPEGFYVIAGDSRVWYGHLVEHGTSHSPARPFLVPALEEHEQHIINAASRAIRRAVEGR